MSTEEISRFCNHISALVKEKCYAEGFQKAAEKIREYPHNETLLHSLTLLLDT